MGKKKKTNGEHPCPIWDITWCEPHMLEEVCHMEQETTHETANWLPMSTTATVIHSGCLKNVFVILHLSYCVRAEQKEKSLPFNTLEIDSSKTGHYQDSHDRLKHGKMWSALLIKLNASIFVCTLAASAARPKGRGKTRLRRWTQIVHRFRLGSGRKKKSIQCV